MYKETDGKLGFTKLNLTKKVFFLKGYKVLCVLC